MNDQTPKEKLSSIIKTLLSGSNEKIKEAQKDLHSLEKSDSFTPYKSLIEKLLYVCSSHALAVILLSYPIVIFLFTVVSSVNISIRLSIYNWIGHDETAMELLSEGVGEIPYLSLIILVIKLLPILFGIFYVGYKFPTVLSPSIPLAISIPISLVLTIILLLIFKIIFVTEYAIIFGLKLDVNSLLYSSLSLPKTTPIYIIPFYLIIRDWFSAILYFLLSLYCYSSYPGAEEYIKNAVDELPNDLKFEY